MRDLDRTLRAISTQGWTVVLLAPRSKKPAGSAWQMTKNLSEVRRHLGEGGNLGLVCGSVSGVVVLDFDDLTLARLMFDELGPLPITVVTGSGKWHSYINWQPNLPAKIHWQGKLVGEVQRGPMQQVVMPPSIHPNGQPYAWNLRISGVAALPEAWVQHLLEEDVVLPDWLKPYTDLPRHILEEEEWEGPPPEELLRRAMEQPGAKHRSYGVKFQCPGCRAEGHDKHKDNALVGSDGRWGCAFASNTAAEADHKQAIGEALLDDRLAEGLVSDEIARKIREQLLD